MTPEELPPFDDPTAHKTSLWVKRDGYHYKASTAHLRAQIEALPDEKREQLVASIVVDLDANDSAALRELRAAIDDYIGWASLADEEAGDYVARIKQFAEAAFDSVPRSAHEELRGRMRTAERQRDAADEENGYLAKKLDAEIWERRKAEAELERMRPVVEAAETARNYRDEVLSNYTPANPAKVCHLGLGSYVSQRDLALWHAVDEYRKGDE